MLQRPSFRKEHGTPCQQAAVASIASSASSGGACSVTASAARRSHMILCALVPDRMAWVSKRSSAAPSRPTLAILLSMRCSRPSQRRATCSARLMSAMRMSSMSSMSMIGPFEAPGFAYSQDTFLPFGNQLVEVCPPPPQGIQADQHVIADRHVNRPKIEQIEGEGLPVEG